MKFIRLIQAQKFMETLVIQRDIKTFKIIHYSCLLTKIILKMKMPNKL